jgi:2-phospho-L-lactate transferase/gluconeogenesis factor (CofD/UPF0052 family)
MWVKSLCVHPTKRRLQLCRLVQPPRCGAPCGLPAPSKDADVVLIGPGAFLPQCMRRYCQMAYAKRCTECRGKVIFVDNTTTQTGQTEHLDNVGHVAMLVALLGSGVLDVVLLNNRLASRAHQIARLVAEGLKPLRLSRC